MNKNRTLKKGSYKTKVYLVISLLFVALSTNANNSPINKEKFESYINNSEVNEINQFNGLSDNHSNSAIIVIDDSYNTNIVTYQEKKLSGKSNNVKIKTEGINNNIISSQIGSDNTAYIISNGNENLAIMKQYGINNNGFISQNGNNNDAGIIQSGYGNYDIIEQNGNGNKALIINTAINLRGSSGSKITQDNSRSPILLIDGMSNYNISVNSK